MGQQPDIAARERFGAAVNSGGLRDVDELVAPGAAFPDRHIEVEHLTAVGDDAMIACTVTGLQHSPLMGHGRLAGLSWCA